MTSVRLRRLRQDERFRRLIRENDLKVDQLVAPFFVVEGKGIEKPIASMPGISQYSLDTLLKEVGGVAQSGVGSILLFGVPSEKDAQANGAWDAKGIVPQAITAIKKEFPKLLVMSDVCLCAYTDHGHCGLVEKNGNSDGVIVNDASVEVLAKMALAHAQAGVDMVSPSDMMDGRVGAIRDTLDENGFDQVPIMSYAVKYASSFYGPFRDAAESPPQFGDRRSYQMDSANQDEALREGLQDMAEGADILMVKPALTSLDIISQLKETTGLPIAAYNVSGEYAMVKAAAEKGWLNEKEAVLEMLTSMTRAGAQILVTYWAKDVAQWLQE